MWVINGTTPDTPDTPDRRTPARLGAQDNQYAAGYPQIRLAALVACGTRDYAAVGDVASCEQVAPPGHPIRQLAQESLGSLKRARLRRASRISGAS